MLKWTHVRIGAYKPSSCSKFLKKVADDLLLSVTQWNIFEHKIKFNGILIHVQKL